MHDKASLKPGPAASRGAEAEAGTSYQAAQHSSAARLNSNASEPAKRGEGGQECHNGECKSKRGCMEAPAGSGMDSVRSGSRQAACSRVSGGSDSSVDCRRPMPADRPPDDFLGAGFGVGSRFAQDREVLLRLVRTVLSEPLHMSASGSYYLSSLLLGIVAVMGWYFTTSRSQCCRVCTLDHLLRHTALP